MPDKRVIVARYDENVAWLTRLPDGWDFYVVQKGEHLPNEGREASSYCWWVATHHGQIDPAGTYAFLQGAPHEPHGFREEHLRPVDRFAALGRDWITEDFASGWIEGRYVDPLWRGATRDCWRRWASRTVRPPKGRHTFTIGAQFLATGRVLLSHPPEWWAALGRYACDGFNPWVLERCWQYVLGTPYVPAG